MLTGLRCKKGERKKRLEVGLVFWMKKRTGAGETGRRNKQDKKGEREIQKESRRERGGGGG